MSTEVRYAVKLEQISEEGEWFWVAQQDGPKELTTEWGDRHLYVDREEALKKVRTWRKLEKTTVEFTRGKPRKVTIVKVSRYTTPLTQLRAGVRRALTAIGGDVDAEKRILLLEGLVREVLERPCTCSGCPQGTRWWLSRAREALK